MSQPPSQSETEENERLRLLDRIRGAYPIAIEQLTIGPVTLEFTRVAEPDTVLQQMDERGDGAPPWQPYWAEAWDSARGVAEVLVRRNLAGANVLDLGCGLGLTGAIAAARDSHVLMVDAAQPALLFARLNSWPWRRRVRTRRLNWRTDNLSPERFSWIIGSDVLYDSGEWPHLEAFWRNHLITSGAVLLGEPGRRMGDQFPAWLTARGWRIQQSEIAVTGTAKPIRIFEASRTDC